MRRAASLCAFELSADGQALVVPFRACVAVNEGAGLGIAAAIGLKRREKVLVGPAIEYADAVVRVAEDQQARCPRFEVRGAAGDLEC